MKNFINKSIFLLLASISAVNSVSTMDIPPNFMERLEVLDDFTENPDSFQTMPEKFQKILQKGREIDSQLTSQYFKHKGKDNEQEFLRLKSEYSGFVQQLQEFNLEEECKEESKEFIELFLVTLNNGGIGKATLPEYLQVDYTEFKTSGSTELFTDWFKAKYTLRT